MNHRAKVRAQGRIELLSFYTSKAGNVCCTLYVIRHWALNMFGSFLLKGKSTLDES
jgi:hypothetical protein